MNYTYNHYLISCQYLCAHSALITHTNNQRMVTCWL